jgi:hypothetical protein
MVYLSVLMRSLAGHYIIRQLPILVMIILLPAAGSAASPASFDSTLSAIKTITDNATRLTALQALDEKAAGIKPTQFVRYYEALVDAYTRLKNDSGMMVSHSQLASFYARTNRFDEALSHHFAALHIAEQREDYDQQITSYLRIGFTYKNIAEVSHNPADLDKAMSYS